MSYFTITIPVEIMVEAETEEQAKEKAFEYIENIKSMLEMSQEICSDSLTLRQEVSE